MEVHGKRITAGHGPVHTNKEIAHAVYLHSVYMPHLPAHPLILTKCHFFLSQAVVNTHIMPILSPHRFSVHGKVVNFKFGLGSLKKTYPFLSTLQRDHRCTNSHSINWTCFARYRIIYCLSSISPTPDFMSCRHCFSFSPW